MKHYEPTDEARAALERAAQVHVTDGASYTAATALLVDVRAERKRREAWFETIKKPMNTLRAEVLRLEKETVGPARQLEDALARAVSDFHIADAKRRAAEQRLLIEAQRQVVAVAVSTQAESLRAQAAAEPDPIARAVLEEQVEATITHPLLTVVPKREPAPESAVSFITRWGVDAVDVKELARAVAEGVVDTAAILPNMVWLNERARESTSLLEIPGVTVIEKKIPVVR